MTELRQVSLKKELVDKIEQILKKHPEYGYKNINDFLEDAIINGLKKIKRIIYLYTILLISTVSVLAYLILFSS